MAVLGETSGTTGGISVGKILSANPAFCPHDVMEGVASADGADA